MKTLTFRERYQGPDGPHLSLLTQTTLHGTYKPEFQKSIHPFGRASGHSTAKPPKVHGVSGFGVRRTKTRRSSNWSK